MTSPDILKVKAIGALMEAIDPNDEDDAKVAVKMVKGIIDGATRGRQVVASEPEPVGNNGAD